jgi:trk system potassium uptake protein TrkA
MRVIVVGAGEVGYHTAHRLSIEGHEVVVIEADRRRLSEIEERINVMGVEGSGAHAETLEAAGVRSCGLFIAVTDIDEVNIVACLLAREYNVPTKIARVKAMGSGSTNPLLSAHKLGIEMIINPLDAVAQDIVNIAAHSSALEIAEFADGRILFVGYPVAEDNPLCGVTISELGDLGVVYPFVMTAITRNGATIIPRGEDTVEAGDHVFLLLRKDDHPSVRYMLGFEHEHVKRMTVLGGGDIGYRVARHFEKNKLRVTVVDPDDATCDRLAEQLDSAMVLKAPIIDVATLTSEGIGLSDVVVAVSGDEERNILAALLAKKNGASRALCLVDTPDYVSLAPSLGIDACVSPRLSTANAILKYVRRGDILSVATVEENQAEVIEFLVSGEMPFIDKKLKDLSFPTGAIIGAIVTDERIEIASGDTVMHEGDRVVVFAVPESIVAVEAFFGVA